MTLHPGFFPFRASPTAESVLLQRLPSFITGDVGNSGSPPSPWSAWTSVRWICDLIFIPQFTSFKRHPSCVHFSFKRLGLKIEAFLISVSFLWSSAFSAVFRIYGSLWNTASLRLEERGTDFGNRDFFPYWAKRENNLLSPSFSRWESWDPEGKWLAQSQSPSWLVTESGCGPSTSPLNPWPLPVKVVPLRCSCLSDPYEDVHRLSAEDRGGLRTTPSARARHRPDADAASPTEPLVWLELHEAATSRYKSWWAFSLTLRTIHLPQNLESNFYLLRNPAAMSHTQTSQKAAPVPSTWC